MRRALASLTLVLAACSSNSAPGPAGSTGATGATGAQGSIGLEGDTGSTGPIGIQGEPGLPGATGPGGATGATGANGSPGATGPQGAAGLTWLGTWNSTTSYTAGDGVFFNGASYIATSNNTANQPPGAVWSLLASMGGTGLEGATGANGATGVTGSTGVQGLPGALGPTGAVGAAGSAGAAGPTGAPGAVGAVGPDGRTGATGAIGATGVAGVTGAAGATGAIGAAGVAGITGATGAIGATGVAGSTGATGATGTAGAAGVIGATGAAGPSGSAGLAGATGAVGATGATGAGANTNPNYCLTTTNAGCSAATAATSCKTLVATSSFSGGDGRYFISPGGATPFEAYCDMSTEGGGWTRVFVLQSPATGCVMGTGAISDPRFTSACAKYTDATINLLATENIFYTQLINEPRLFTKYTGVISSSTNAVNTIGQLVNKESYAAVKAAAATYTPAYSGFRLFGQQNWYQSDTQLGSRPSSCRFSLEYLDTTSIKYACCDPDCSVSGSELQLGLMVAFVK